MQTTLVLVSAPLQEFEAFRGCRNVSPVGRGCVSYPVFVHRRARPQRDSSCNPMRGAHREHQV